MARTRETLSPQAQDIVCAQIRHRIRATFEKLMAQLTTDLRRLQEAEGAAHGSPEILGECTLEGVLYTFSRVACLTGQALSRREYEVATLVARDFSNKMIAQELGIRPATVASHLRSIYTKLNIPSRHVLAQWRGVAPGQLVS